MTRLSESITAAGLEGIDWDRDRAEVGELIGRLLPIENLVPDIYGEWRPVVRDAVAFVGSHLSPHRLVPKLLEQSRLPSDLSVEKRLLIMIQGMPSLQKIGQTVARNRNLDTSFRVELSRLENAIHDVTAEDMRAEIERELGSLLDEDAIEVEREIVAEASVSAVMGFTWLDSETGGRSRGVFKVLKPHIKAHFAEELEILSGLARYFDGRRGEDGLSGVKLSGVFEEVRRLLEQEVRFEQEQANLKLAASRYSKVPGVRVPKLIEKLCTPRVTAMSAESGVKVTEAFAGPHDAAKRRRIAGRLIEALVAIPLLSPEPDAVLHADPHAGNLFADPETEELVLLDWALTSHLPRAERRAILLLLTAVALRDRRLITYAAVKLSQFGPSYGREKAAVVRREVRRFLDDLSPFGMAGVRDALALVDRLMLAGIEFSSSLAIFRKMLFTLDGVLHDIAPGMRMDPTLAWYVARQRAKTSRGVRRLSGAKPIAFDLPLSGIDQLVAAWSAQFFWIRTGLQTGRQVRRMGLRKLREYLAGC